MTSLYLTLHPSPDFRKNIQKTRAKLASCFFVSETINLRQIILQYPLDEPFHKKGEIMIQLLEDPAKILFLCYPVEELRRVHSTGS
ncbi:hypothetical protein PAENIP36_38900 [Paenibacillus sp. P36]